MVLELYSKYQVRCMMKSESDYEKNIYIMNCFFFFNFCLTARKKNQHFNTHRNLVKRLLLNKTKIPKTADCPPPGTDSLLSVLLSSVSSDISPLPLLLQTSAEGFKYLIDCPCTSYFFTCWREITSGSKCVWDSRNSLMTLNFIGGEMRCLLAF